MFVIQVSMKVSFQMETFMGTEFLHMLITDNTMENGKTG